MHAICLIHFILLYSIIRFLLVFSEKYTLWGSSSGDDADYWVTIMYSQDSELNTDHHENLKSFVRIYQVLLENIDLIKGKVILFLMM
jgi:hypothetical protein